MYLSGASGQDLRDLKESFVWSRLLFLLKLPVAADKLFIFIVCFHVQMEVSAYFMRTVKFLWYSSKYLVYH